VQWTDTVIYIYDLKRRVRHAQDGPEECHAEHIAWKPSQAQLLDCVHGYSRRRFDPGGRVTRAWAV
jgi:hypothetical protein